MFKKITPSIIKGKIQILSRDNIRFLNPHDRTNRNYNNGYNGTVLNYNEFQKILSESECRDQKKVLYEKKLNETLREKKKEEIETRKKRMEEYDIKRQEKKPLRIEIEAKQNNDYLLEKLKTVNDNEEDEIKKLNELILYVKCGVIRDLQIEEKKIY
jgi:hypothetical protein